MQRCCNGVVTLSYLHWPQHPRAAAAYDTPEVRRCYNKVRQRCNAVPLCHCANTVCLGWVGSQGLDPCPAPDSTPALQVRRCCNSVTTLSYQRGLTALPKPWPGNNLVAEPATAGAALLAATGVAALLVGCGETAAVLGGTEHKQTPVRSSDTDRAPRAPSEPSWPEAQLRRPACRTGFARAPTRHSERRLFRSPARPRCARTASTGWCSTVALACPLCYTNVRCHYGVHCSCSGATRGISSLRELLLRSSPLVGP